MSESISDVARPCNLVAGCGSALDIHRDNPTDPPADRIAVPNYTEKVTPDKTFSPEEKRAWRLEQERRLQAWEQAARAIALDYVNNDVVAPEDILLPDDVGAEFARVAYLEERREIRRGQFRSFLKCLRKNGHGPIDLVLYDDRSVRVSGVWRCGSLWQCPRCSSSGLYVYSRRLVEILQAVQGENILRKKDGRPCMSVMFVTFTAPHSAGEPLELQMSLFSGVWSSVLDSRPVRSLRDRFGFIGHVRCYDHTLTFRNGQRDWHTHFHNLLVFDPELPGRVLEDMEDILFPTRQQEKALERARNNAENAREIVADSPEAEEIRNVLFNVWSDRVGKLTGGRLCSDKAFRVEVVKLFSDDRSDKAIADYAAKVVTLPGYLTKSQKLRAGEDVAPGAPFKSLAPFDILDAYLEYGGPSAPYDYAGAWVEYCIATKGYHRVHFSRGLEKALGVDRLAVSYKQARPVCRHELPGPVADVALRNAVVLDGLREAVLSDDVVLYFDALEGVGLADFADNIAEEQEIAPRVLPEAVRVRARRLAARGEDISDLLDDWSGVESAAVEEV